MKNKLTCALIVLWVIVASESSFAQNTSNQTITVVGDANACELNAAHLDNLINMTRGSKERVFVPILGDVKRLVILSTVAYIMVEHI